MLLFEDTGPVLTSTLNGCSSPFTAHKIHSNNCKHNVPIQRLLRHFPLRRANKTIVNPVVVISLCPCSIIVSPPQSMHRQTHTATNPRILAATSRVSPCFSSLSGAETKAEEIFEMERVKRIREKKRIRAAPSPPLPRPRFSRRRLSPGKRSPVSSLPVQRSPGRSSGAAAVVPGGRVQLALC